ncbi:MAG: peptidylprolyl isomerase [Lachnospiraceae bacterium]|nr:peptidylprolyl isomerase [Lachnospiraceae bacterium]
MVKRVGSFFVLIVLVLTLSACQADWSWTFGEQKLLTMGKLGLTEKEMRVIALEYKCLFESYYKELLGEEFWDREVEEGETFEDYVKSEYVLVESRALLYLNQVASERLLKLNDTESEEVHRRAEAYFGQMTPDEREYFVSDVQAVERVMTLYELASKAVNEMLKDQSFEISDEESRVMDVMVIRVSDKALAEELHERIQNGENFATLAKNYSTDSRVLYSLARSELRTEFRSILFALKNGEVSEVLSYQGEYYLIRNVNSFNLLLSNKEKVNLLAAKRYENWDLAFESFIRENEEKINLKAWEELRLKLAGDYPYYSLFSN